MYKRLSNGLKDVLYNLSTSNNSSEWYNDPSMVSYYRGILVTTITAVMAVNDMDFYEAMVVLNSLLPLDHVNLTYIVPTAWVECLYQGRIAVGFCKDAHADAVAAVKMTRSMNPR